MTRSTEAHVRRVVERSVQKILDDAASARSEQIYASKLSHIAAALRAEAEAIEQLAHEVSS